MANTSALAVETADTKLIAGISTAQLLTDYEQCPRRGYLALSWEQNKLNSTRMVTEALRQALTATEGQQWGELAGSAMLQLAQDRGLETTTHKIYDSVAHHACLADLLATVLRKPNDQPWISPEPVQSWTGGCYLSPDGSTLRRLVIVSNWTEERHYSECRSWFTLGEQAAYNLPMQLIWLVIGQQRDGLRSSPWTTGYLHPLNRELRFRKRSKGSRAHAEISRETWLEAMLRDDVLNEVCFREDVPLPLDVHLQRVRDMAKRKLERLHALTEKPEANLSGCEWPVPCSFRKCCHVLPEVDPAEKYGFIPISSH